MGRFLIEAEAYKRYLAAKQQEHEIVCKQCGLCCGALNDPCQHLKKIDNNRYLCSIYQNRLGKHKTISNKIFTCVPIGDIVSKGALPQGCAYSRNRLYEHIS